MAAAAPEARPPEQRAGVLREEHRTLIGRTSTAAGIIEFDFGLVVSKGASLDISPSLNECGSLNHCIAMRERDWERQRGQDWQREQHRKHGGS